MYVYAQIEDRLTLVAEADEKSEKLDDYSRYSSGVVNWAKKQRSVMSRKHDEVERMDPHSRTSKAKEAEYDKMRAKYYADRANQDTAIIRFREFVTSSKRFLDQNRKHENLPEYKKLKKAVKNADGWINFFDERWKDKDWRPPPVDTGTTVGADDPPGVPHGVPVLEIQYANKPFRVNVGAENTVSARFKNNSNSEVLVEIEMVRENNNVSVDPPGKRRFWIPPKGTSDYYSWEVTVHVSAEVSVLVTRQVVRVR